MSKYQKYIVPILLGISVILLGFMHIYMLDRLPRGFNIDEIGSAYDAYALGHYGVDRWGKSWPLYMINYRDGQNILYTYLLVPVLRLFGNSIWAVRSVIVASAFIMAAFGAATFQLIHKGSKMAYAVFFLVYAIMPVFILTLRFGLESHLMMSVASVLLYISVRALQDDRPLIFLSLGIVSGLLLYTYALSYIVVPVFLVLTLVYFMIKRRGTAKNFLIALISFLLLAWPLAVVQIINLFDLPEWKLWKFTFTKLPKYRAGEITADNFFQKILWALQHTILSDGVVYNSIQEYGSFFYISVPFIIIGFVVCLIRSIRSLPKDSAPEPRILILFWGISELLMAGLSLNAPGYTNITRMNGILAAEILMLVEGLWTVLGFFRSVRIKIFLLVLLCSGYGFLFGSFAHYYFTDYDKDAYPYHWLFFEAYPQEAMSYLEDHREEYNSQGMAYLQWLYIYYLWGAKVDPNTLDLELPTGPDPILVNNYWMELPHRMTGLQLYYDGPNNQIEIDWKRNHHFKEIRMDHFLLMIPPYGNGPFFKNECPVSDHMTIRYADMDHLGEDEKCNLFAWLYVDEYVDHPINITLETDTGTVDAVILADQMEEDRKVILFQFITDYEELYNSTKQELHFSISDQNGQLLDWGSVNLK